MDTSNDQAPTAAARRDREDVLADAVRVLTEAARLRRPVMHRADDGQWEAHPMRTKQADWAEFVTQALAGAAANIGSVHAALSGRPGSWEADKLGDLLWSTVGYDKQYLFEHRTEPLRVVVDIEQILTDHDIAWLYDDAEAALDDMCGDATERFDYTPYYWTYTRNDGEWVADESEAPAWSIEAWRASVAATERYDADTLNELERYVLNGPLARSASIVKSPEAARAAAQLAEREDAIVEDFRARLAALTAQRDREWATYAEAFADNVRHEAAWRYPGTPLHIDLIEVATRHTPLPGSGIAPKDYPAGTSIHKTETATGRLPHLRLPEPATEQERG